MLLTLMKLQAILELRASVKLWKEMATMWTKQQSCCQADNERTSPVPSSYIEHGVCRSRFTCVDIKGTYSEELVEETSTFWFQAVDTVLPDPLGNCLSLSFSSARLKFRR